MIAGGWRIWLMVPPAELEGRADSGRSEKLFTIIKASVGRVARGFGYSIVRHTTLSQLMTTSAALDAEIKGLRAVMEQGRREARPDINIATDSLIDFQIEMAKYYVKISMGDIEPSFTPIYDRCKAWSVASVEQLYAIYQAMAYLVQAGLPGDVVDCGTGRGGAAMSAMLSLMHFGVADRRIVLYDSSDTTTALATSAAKTQPDTDSELPDHLNSTGYPPNLISVRRGMLERTLATGLPRDIAFMRLNTDCYVSTMQALSVLFPRVVPGGVIVVDDCGPLLGPRKAFEDYCTEQQVPLLLSRVDYRSRVTVKTAGNA